jgi:hypothetical protein
MSLDLSSVATKLMKSLGDETYITITRKSGGTFDPVAGETTGEVLTTLSAVGVVDKVDSKLVDGTRIKATDKMVLLDNGVTPLYTDLINFNGISNTVQSINELNHAGTTQMWEVVTRG